jgi:hypothetical protein
VYNGRVVVDMNLFRSFGAPGKNGDSFVLDMATSTVALGKIEISQRRGMNIPNTWGVNSDGKIDRVTNQSCDDRFIVDVRRASDQA